MTELPVRIAVMPPVPVVAARRLVTEPAGDWTIDDVVEATGLPREALSVSLDGSLVPRAAWAATVPAPGQSVIVGQRPSGTGLEAILVQLASYVSNLFVAQQIQRGLSALSEIAFGHDTDPTVTGPQIRRTIAGDSNSFRPYEVVPQVLGRHRLYPPLAARGYTVEEGGKLYQYALFTFGHGPLVLSDLKLGDDPLFKSSTVISYTGIMNADAGKFGGDDGTVIKLEIRQGGASDAAITLFSKNVQEIIVGTPLREAIGWVTTRTVERTTRISVLVSCPQGLISFRRSGGTEERSVRLNVEYRSATSTGSWTEVTRILMTGETKSSVHASRDIDVTEGTYDVRVRRVSSEGEDSSIIDATAWDSMLCHRAGDVVEAENLCLVAARIRITNNFPRLVNQFNAIAQTYVLDWNGASWALAATSNPASLFRHVLQGDANHRPVADAQINLTELAAWHEENDDNGFEFNFVANEAETVLDVLRKIAAAGRGSPGVQDGLFTVIRENDLTGAPVQHFSPRNVRNFSERRRLLTMPDAWKVQFVDPDAGYLETERIVPDDGFTEDTATTFERLALAGITDSDQAYKLGRYHLAAVRLRPAEYIFETDFEHLDCVRGDLVRMNHDVILVGLAAGRVVSVTMSGGDNTGVVVDQECPMAADTYGIRFRKSDGSSVLKVVTTAAGNQTTLTYTTPITAGNPMPVAGDLFLFGVSGSDSAQYIVKDIEPIDELGARVTLVDAAAGILTADSGTIPAYNPSVTIPPKINPPTPAPPRVNDVVSATEPRSSAIVGARRGSIRIYLGTRPVAVHP